MWLLSGISMRSFKKEGKKKVSFYLKGKTSILLFSQLSRREQIVMQQGV